MKVLNKHIHYVIVFASYYTAATEIAVYSKKITLLNIYSEMSI